MFQTLDENSPLKLADFGISRVVQHEGDEMSTVVGTPTYLAPEVLVGQKYTHMCDIYSLGTIFYILLCGYPPFDDSDNPNFYDDVVSGNLKFPEAEWSNISSEGFLSSERLDSENA